MSSTSRLFELEDHYLGQFTQEPGFAAIAHSSREEIIQILMQRRILSLFFTQFCTALMCGLDSNAARDVVDEIVRDEYHPLNHRELFMEELGLLGVSRRRVIAKPLTSVTRRAIWRQVTAAETIMRTNDLQRLVLLRFLGEVTPGVEFQTLYHRLEELGAYRNHSSPFLAPHVQYDVSGPGDGASHAERYVSLIVNSIMQEKDWNLVDSVLNLSTQIRIQFYSQFRPNE